MPGLRRDESPHAIRRRFSESSDLPRMQLLIKLCRESKVVLVQQMEFQWWWSSRLGSRAFVCLHLASALVGRVKQKLAPRGELSAAHKRPPCDSIIERLMRSPMPVP